MNPPNLLAQRMIEAVKRYVSRSMDFISDRVDEMEKRIHAIPAGPKGNTGNPGERGATGEPGRDGAEMDILPSIDETRSYRRGTWASHNGGLIRSVRQTDPVTASILESGWMVMVEGVAGFVVIQDSDNPRKLSVAAMLTSGTKTITECVIPVMIYRNIWKASEKYTQGDVVTWNGSTWHLNESESKGVPGTPDSGWQMIVKSGRDGKDTKGREPEPPNGPVRLK